MWKKLLFEGLKIAGKAASIALLNWGVPKVKKIVDKKIGVKNEVS